MTDFSITALLPEIVLCLGGIAILVADPFLGKPGRSVGGPVAGVAFVGAALAAVLAPTSSQVSFNGMVASDAFSLFFRLVFFFAGILLVVGSAKTLRHSGFLRGEFHALLLFAAAGMDFMAVSKDLLMMFIGLEMVAMSTYVLAAFRTRDPRSSESGVKYFFVGSLSSAIMLYGLAWVYGSAGSLQLDRVKAFMDAAASVSGTPFGFVMGGVFLLAGLCFKIAAAPFHVWAPDVYEGAPTPVAAFLSVGPKAAGFAALLRVAALACPLAGWPFWEDFLSFSAVLTILVGNFGALVQTDFKRMLAYSSVAHAGYILIGVLVGGESGVSAVLFYLAAYTAMNLCAFAVAAVVAGPDDGRTAISSFKGMGFSRPALCIPLALIMLSLTGIPATAGFVGKFQIFGAALGKGIYAPVFVAILGSLVSAYYYLNVVVTMFMSGEGGDAPAISAGERLAIYASAGLVLALGVYPAPLLDATRRVAAAAGLV